MKITSVKQTFMVHVPGDVGVTDFGNRLVEGTQALGAYVKEKLETLSAGSKETMRGIIEQDEGHVMAMFRGRERIDIYNESERQRVVIRLITKSITS